MRHIKAFVLALRIIGVLFLASSAFVGFQRFMMLRYVIADATVTPNIVMYVSILLPCIIMLAIGIVCFIVAAIMKKKQ